MSWGGTFTNHNKKKLALTPPPTLPTPTSALFYFSGNKHQGKNTTSSCENNDTKSSVNYKKNLQKNQFIYNAKWNPLSQVLPPLSLLSKLVTLNFALKQFSSLFCNTGPPAPKADTNLSHLVMSS